MRLESALVASLHFIALALGGGGVFARGVALRRLLDRRDNLPALKALFLADAFWGIAAILWLVTGLLRAFAGLEKGSHFYTHNTMFWVKLTLFVAVVLLELWPMMTFIRWRIARAKDASWKIPDAVPLRALVRVNDVELAITVCIVFAASLMARAIGY